MNTMQTTATIRWTDDAEEALAAHLHRQFSGADWSAEERAEAEEDIRRHIEEELAASGAGEATAARLRPVLAKLGAGFPEAAEATPAFNPAGVASEQPSVKAAGKPVAIRRGAWALLLIFGILIPLGTLVFELISGACGEIFFTPIPTYWHALLVAVPPVGALLAKRAIDRGFGGRRARVAAVLSGAGLAVSLYYAALFLPLAPFAVAGIVYLGFGFVPLAPFLALGGVLFVRRRMKRAAASEVFTRGGVNPAHSPLQTAAFRRYSRIGIAAALVLLCGLELPRYVSRGGMLMAVSNYEPERAFGLGLLRAVGHRETMLRACYENGRALNRVTDTAGWAMAPFGSPPTDDAREVFYRVTGTPFNAEPPPVTSARGMESWASEFDFDDEMGGDAVGGRVRGLTLKASRIDAHLDPVSALGYQEWTCVFDNRSDRQREARMQVLLPPGGAVTRLTLWVHGEPEEAAFAATPQVKQAYKSIVFERRDPVLVTDCGPDRVFVQCFPVPPKGEMKIRLGITAPLAKGATLALPQIIERNFADGEPDAAVWAQSDAPLAEAGGMKPLPAPEGGFAQQGGGVASVALRDPVASAGTAWAEDPFAPDAERIVVGHRAVEALPPARRIAFAVDTSAAMRGKLAAVAEAIAALPDSCGVSAHLATDGGEAESASGKDAAAKLVRAASAKGGRDNAPALAAALQAAGGDPEAAIIWVHGPQGVDLGGMEAASQIIERLPIRAAIYDAQIAPGPDRLLAALAAAARVRPAPVAGAEALGGFAGQVAAGLADRRWTWERRADADGLPPEQKTNDQLARYAAFDEIHHAAPDTGGLAERAARYQLVTPYSGAVVLETKAQFAQNQLEQVDPTATPKIPAVPEPGGATLVLAWFTLWALRRRRAA